MIMGLEDLVWQRWRQGQNTADIALELGERECDVERALNRALDAKRNDNPTRRMADAHSRRMLGQWADADYRRKQSSAISAGHLRKKKPRPAPAA